MRPVPVPPRLMALRTRCLSSGASSSRFGPVTPCAWTASSVWQLLQFWMKSYLPVLLLRRVGLGAERSRCRPSASPRPADHRGRDDHAEREVEQQDRDVKMRPPRVR